MRFDSFSLHASPLLHAWSKRYGVRHACMVRLIGTMMIQGQHDRELPARHQRVARQQPRTFGASRFPGPCLRNNRVDKGFIPVLYRPRAHGLSTGQALVSRYNSIVLDLQPGYKTFWSDSVRQHLERSCRVRMYNPWLKASPADVWRMGWESRTETSWYQRARGSSCSACRHLFALFQAHATHATTFLSF